MRAWCSNYDDTGTWKTETILLLDDVKSVYNTITKKGGLEQAKKTLLRSACTKLNITHKHKDESKMREILKESWEIYNSRAQGAGNAGRAGNAGLPSSSTADATESDAAMLESTANNSTRMVTMRSEVAPVLTRLHTGYITVVPNYSDEQQKADLESDARMYDVDPHQLGQLKMCWATTTPENQLNNVEGYDHNQGGFLTRLDLLTLRDGEELTDEVMHVVGMGMFFRKDSMLWVDSSTLEKMYPVSLPGNTAPGQQPHATFWNKIAGDRVIGDQVKYVIAPHHVPGHWCLVVVDFKNLKIIYYCSICQGSYASQAANHIATWLQAECERQKVADRHRPINFTLVKWTRGPRQPSDVDCAVCVLSVAEELATKGEDAFYSIGSDAAPHWQPIQMTRQRYKYGCYAISCPNKPGAIDW